MPSYLFWPKTLFFQLQEHERNNEIDQLQASSRTNTLNPSASFYVRASPGGENNSRTVGGTRSFMPMRSASMRETSHSRSIRRYFSNFQKIYSPRYSCCLDP